MTTFLQLTCVKAKRFICSLTLLFLILPMAQADSLQQSRQIINQTHKQLKQTQQKINKLNDNTNTMVDDYKTTLRETETYKTYNRQLADIVKSQKNELLSIKKQIEDIAMTSQQIMPLMDRMIQMLEQFIAQDLPFLEKERSQRIASLYSGMKRADLSVAEKYRKVLEAYQIEIEYGKTLETYKAKLKDKKVNYLKVGRSAFFYQTLDKKTSAVWNKQKKLWQLIDDGDVEHSINVAIKMAGKQQSPELLIVLAEKAEAMQ